MWSDAYKVDALTFGNYTNNRDESQHCQLKRYLKKQHTLHISMMKVCQWNIVGYLKGSKGKDYL